MVVGEFTQETDLLVIGGGPGGYSAAFGASANGVQTTIVDEMGALGGVCLHRGCIPSKTLLSVAETLHTARASSAMGIHFDAPRIDLDALREWKRIVIEKLTAGLAAQAKKYKVDFVKGKARFEDSKTVILEGGEVSRIRFRRAILATGSRAMTLPKAMHMDSPRVMTSRQALDFASIPPALLVIGGGYIGLELGSVYAALGSKVTVVEMLPALIANADPDLVRPLAKKLEESFEAICLETRVTSLKETDKGVEAGFDGKNVPKRKVFDAILVAVGRRPNTDGLALENTKVEKDEKGFVKVDDRFQTTDSRIWAIGDLIGNPMLAHKAHHEGRVCGDIIAGKDAVFDPRSIPAVVFTDPEIAWTGLTQEEAKASGREVVVKKIPWSASGRAVSIGRTDGLTKIIFDKESERVLGVGLVGPHAGEMISEAVLAIEMGATAFDLANTIHPHPTLAETVGEVASLMG